MISDKLAHLVHSLKERWDYPHFTDEKRRQKREMHEISSATSTPSWVVLFWKFLSQWRGVSSPAGLKLSDIWDSFSYLMPHGVEGLFARVKWGLSGTQNLCQVKYLTLLSRILELITAWRHCISFRKDSQTSWDNSYKKKRKEVLLLFNIKFEQARTIGNNRHVYQQVTGYTMEYYLYTIAIMQQDGWISK